MRDAATREPIAGASASTSDGRPTSTNERGEFTLAAHAGHVTVHVRRIGYDAISADVDAPSPSDTRYVFEMRRAVQSLEAVAVATEGVSWSPKHEGFEHRLARNTAGTSSRGPSLSSSGRSQSAISLGAHPESAS